MIFVFCVFKVMTERVGVGGPGGPVPTGPHLVLLVQPSRTGPAWKGMTVSACSLYQCPRTHPASVYFGLGKVLLPWGRPGSGGRHCAEVISLDRDVCHSGLPLSQVTLKCVPLATTWGTIELVRET